MNPKEDQSMLQMATQIFQSLPHAHKLVIIRV